MKTLPIGPSAVTSEVNEALSAIFNSTNCAIVYSTDGLYKSWIPGRPINAFTSVIIGGGYIAQMKTTLDVTGIFSEGASGGGSSADVGVALVNATGGSLGYSYADEDGTLLDEPRVLTSTAIVLKSADFPVGATQIIFSDDLSNYYYSQIDIVPNITGKYGPIDTENAISLTNFDLGLVTAREGQSGLSIIELYTLPIESEVSVVNISTSDDIEGMANGANDVLIHSIAGFTSGNHYQNAVRLKRSYINNASPYTITGINAGLYKIITYDTPANSGTETEVTIEANGVITTLNPADITSKNLLIVIKGPSA